MELFNRIRLNKFETFAQASPTENGHHDDSMRLDDGVLSPEDSDLAQLRSLNDTELSADWYNFQVRTKCVVQNRI